MSTLQYKQIKSQKQHLKILWGQRAEGPKADTWGRGSRAERNKYTQKISLNFQTSYCILKIRRLGGKLCVAFQLFLILKGVMAF